MYDGQFSHEMKPRRNTKPSRTQKGKDKYVSIVDDIIAVMLELDKKEITTCFVATNLARLPRCDPKDVDPYGNLQLILELHERVQGLEDNLGSVKAQALVTSEDVKKNSKT